MYGSVRHQIHEHTEMVDRVSAARILEEELNELHQTNEQLRQVVPSDIVIDGMDNLISISFGALPERLAVIVDGKLAFLGGKGPEEYSVLECRRALQEILSSRSQ